MFINWARKASKAPKNRLQKEEREHIFQVSSGENVNRCLQTTCFCFGGPFSPREKKYFSYFIRFSKSIKLRTQNKLTLGPQCAEQPCRRKHRATSSLWRSLCNNLSRTMYILWHPRAPRQLNHGQQDNLPYASKKASIASGLTGICTGRKGRKKSPSFQPRCLYHLNVLYHRTSCLFFQTYL